ARFRRMGRLVYGWSGPRPGRNLDAVERELAEGGEPRDADADEPKGAGPVAEPAVEQPAREVADLVGVVDADLERGRAAADREVGVAELRRDGAGDLARPLQVLRDLAGHVAQLHVQELPLDEVALEGVLDTDRDALDVELEAAWIDAARTVSQDPAHAAGQQAAEGVVVERRERTDRVDAGGTQTLFCLRPDTRQLADVERREERGLLTGNDDHEPARLARVTPHLGHDLARRDAERARQARRPPHGRLHGLGDDARLEEVAGDLAHCEIALVEPRLLDGRDDAAHGRPDVTGVLAVDGVPRTHEDRVRAASDRFGGAHRRVDAEPARDVVRGRDDAATPGVAADDERLRPQIGVLELLDGSVEGVEVEVRDDHAFRLVEAPGGLVEPVAQLRRA